MNKDDAKEYAKTMSFHNAVYNAMKGKCIPFRKATAIKLKELLKLVDNVEKVGHWIALDEKSAVCSCCNRGNALYGDFCKWCGVKMERKNT